MEHDAVRINSVMWLTRAHSAHQNTETSGASGNKGSKVHGNVAHTHTHNHA